ncbi:putative transmembrane protein ZNF593OS [Acanthopagrus schlegelii]
MSRPASYKDLYIADKAFNPTHTEPRRDQNRTGPEPGTAAGRQILPSSSLLFEPPRTTTAADMIIRLGRLTPGYFRLLQRQVAGEVQTHPQDRAINQIAMMLAIMGLSLSYYSAKQMTEKVQAQPAP